MGVVSSLPTQAVPGSAALRLVEQLDSFVVLGVLLC